VPAGKDTSEETESNGRGAELAERDVRRPEARAELEALVRLVNAQAKANAPYMRAKRAIEALRNLDDDATEPAKARALGIIFTAVAEALEDTDPLFEPQRGRLREFVSIAGNTIAKLKKHAEALEADHVLALLVVSRDAYRGYGDCTLRECLAYVGAWLTEHGYERAAEHVTLESSRVEGALRAATAAEFNKAAHELLNARGFAPMSLGNVKVRKSRLTLVDSVGRKVRVDRYGHR
jgi:hypothetical protein